MVGLKLGQYRIDAIVGDGGMGVVYRAYDERLQRDVAIKVLKGGPPVPATTLLQEARAAAGLQHPGICVVYEVGEQNGLAFIAMELVEGVPLARLIPPTTGLPLNTTLDYAIQIGDALAYAHDRGVLHRDLKSSNILVSNDGRVRILDFGLAIRVRERGADATVTIDSAEEAGVLAGTLAYMAPELLQGEAADRRGDVWAFGVVLFEMLSGRRPFEGRTGFALSSAILTSDPPPLPADANHAIEAIVSKCLAKRATARYQTMAEVVAALTAVRETARHVRRARAPRRSRSFATAGIATVILLGALAAMVLTSRSGSTRGLRRIAIVADVREPLTPDVDAIVDGVIERVIDTLAEGQRDRLRVIALSSVRRYKGRPVDGERVARELNVDDVAILRITAGVDSSLAITGELADAHDHAHLWGERFTASPTSVLLVQDEIATRILAALDLQLEPDQRRQLAKGATADPDAYLLYLRGRYAWYEPTETGEGYQQSLEYYRQAIARDPRFALAHIGIADTYISMLIEGWLPHRDVADKAEAELAIAQSLERDLPQAHYTRGTLLAYVRGKNWPEAIDEQRTAVALNPTSPHYHRHFAQLLIALGRFDEGLAEYERGVSVDPLGLASNTGLGSGYFWTRQYGKAEAQYRKAVSLAPTSSALHEMLSQLYAAQHKDDRSFEELVRSVELSESREVAAQLRAEADRIGRDAAVRQFSADRLAVARAVSEKTWVSPMYLALLSIQAGLRDEAFAWLERARVEQQPWLHFLRVDPAVDPIRSDPRFTALLQRVGTPGRQ
jgi:eukaryotic-like serine/threonine-protein kinase